MSWLPACSPSPAYAADRECYLDLPTGWRRIGCRALARLPLSAAMIREHETGPFLVTEGIHNLRDYGGYAVPGGGRVKTGLLYRSGHHADATEPDLQTVAALGLTHVVDLRGDSERARHTCRRPHDFSATVLFFEGETAGLAPHLEAAEDSVDANSAHRAMVELYAALPDRVGLNAVLRRYFAALATGAGSTLVHCAAGKDRTGIAVDLLHHLLGVHPDDAMADYLLTNESPRNEERIAHGRALMGGKYGARDEQTIRVLMGVDPAFLEAARHSVIERFGSTDSYLEQHLGVDAEMRAALIAELVEQ